GGGGVHRGRQPGQGQAAAPAAHDAVRAVAGCSTAEDVAESAASAPFTVARNPDRDSSLPYLLRVPVDGAWMLLKAREPWPRTAKVYCHRFDAWPADAEVVEDVKVRFAGWRGPALDLVLDRGRENRSQFVFARGRGGREAVFWQSPRTTTASRPGVRIPQRRAAGVGRLAIVQDTRERYAYRFATHPVDV